jgi:hypothetical protein
MIIQLGKVTTETKQQSANPTSDNLVMPIGHFAG